MLKGKAFVLVGHSNYGKSYTLRALKETYGGGERNHSVTIGGKRIQVRERSNDDKPVTDLIDFIRRMSDKGQDIIIALCPKFSGKHRMGTEKLLNFLVVFYEVSFMVLKKAQRPKDLREIEESEVNDLRVYGRVEILSEKLENNKKELADKFRGFIEKNF